MNIFNKPFFKWVELTLIFIGLPLLFYFDGFPFHKSVPLLTVFIVFLIILLRDKSFDKKLFRFSKQGNWKIIFARFVVFAALSFVAVKFFIKETPFYLPQEKTGLWFLIIISYPVWSAYPQELIYRAYFYHRYKDLVKREWILIIMNAFLFSFSHIIFENWLALVLTFFGGIMFSITYKKSNSLMVVFSEHTLYGIWIFTIGLGQYFYAP